MLEEILNLCDVMGVVCSMCLKYQMCLETLHRIAVVTYQVGQ